MEYCVNCGTELVGNAKFCQKCGTPNTFNKESTRKQEFVGSVKKCPSCGEEINSFTAICPACGHEINSQKVSDNLERFIVQINDCEKEIAQTAPTNRGWSTWSTTKKVWWVIFNILFACIPLAIYWGYPLITIKATPKLTKEEKQLASLIENYTFPNDRESIIEGLVYAKEKIDFISKEKIDKKSAYWMRLWCSKAEQLKQKADLMFPNDPIVKDSCAEILEDEKRVNIKIRNKAICGVLILVIAFIFVLFRSGLFEMIKDRSTVLEVPKTELSILMPQIEGGKGKVVANNSQIFSVEYYGVSSSDFEKYKESCYNNGYVLDVQNENGLYDAYNYTGENIRVTYDDGQLSIIIKASMEIMNIEWSTSAIVKSLPKPKSKVGNISSNKDDFFTVYVANTSIDDFNDYIDACLKKGFDFDYSRYEDSFYAENKKGDNLTILYEGYNTMYINIYNWD